MSLGGYHMKRRVLSLMVTLALCLNLCPVWVLAAGEDDPGGSGSGAQSGGRSSTELDGPQSQDAPSEVVDDFTYDLAGYTITAPASIAIIVKPTGILTLIGGGTINSYSSAAVQVEAGGTLNITESNTELIGNSCALDVAAGAHVSLANGTYRAMGRAIRTADGDLGALLMPGYAFFDKDGSQLSAEDAETAKWLTVAPFVETPGLAWSASSKAVDYDGEPVEAGDLPDVIISGVSDEGALRGELQYSYRRDGSAEDYTGGLPTDAGTYQVIVSLPETESHYAMVSEPITLTVKPIAPVKTAPAAVQLTYNGAAQALVTAGELKPVAVKDGLKIQFATEEHGDYSDTIPTGTNAGDYTVWYRVAGLTGNYIEPNPNPAEISDVEIQKKSIHPTVTLSESSYVYDGSKKTPQVTVRDGADVLGEEQYTVTWTGKDGQPADEIRAVGTYTATVEGVPDGNYSFTATAQVEIVAADQTALTITGKRDDVYYGDSFTLGTTGGTGNGEVSWSVAPDNAGVTIGVGTGALTVNGVGTYTVKAERAVPNYGTAEDSWTFTVKPKQVTAEVTVADKVYDGNTTGAVVTARVRASDLVGSDTVALTGLTGVFDDPNVGAGKTVTLDDTNATRADGGGRYAVSYPASATGNITPKRVTVTVTLSDHNLKIDDTVTPNIYYYEYDGVEKTPNVTVTADDGAVLTAGDYTVSYSGNLNVGSAAVTVAEKAGGNYTFDDMAVSFDIRNTGAELTATPQAKDLTYTGEEQELVTVGTASGGHIEYKLSTETGYSTNIPKAINAGAYKVDYKVVGDGNHDDTAPAQVSVTIKPKPVSSPEITLEQTTYVYDGSEKRPAVTSVTDEGKTIDAGEYSVSYRDNVNAGTATVVITDKNGGNYDIGGTAGFQITKKVPAVTAPTGIDGLQYSGELQALVSAGVCHEGTVVYSVNNGNYSTNPPTASAVGTYTIAWKVLGDANHSDTDPVTLPGVEIARHTVTDPTISLSSNRFQYNGGQQMPTVTVYDSDSQVIPQHEYTVTIEGTNGNVGMVNVDTYTVTVTTPASSNYEIQGVNTRTFEIVKASQEAISITGTKAQVRYGDELQLGVAGGAGGSTLTWEISGNTDTTLTQSGLLTVRDVNSSITVTVKRSAGGNYEEVSASWEFTAAKKPVTAEVTVAAKNWDGSTNVPTGNITATVKAADLAFSGDSITITGLTGAFDDPNVGTDKRVAVDSSNPTVTGTNADRYDITYPATATASILGVAATVDAAPGDVSPSLTYDASQAQALVTAGSVTGGIMVYSLDGVSFTPNIPKGRDAGSYTVYYKAQGDQNHTDSAVDTKTVIIDKQNVTPRIELSPPSARYDSQVHHPDVTLRDGDNNVIPDSEYRAVYVTDGGANWTDVGTYTVKIENITGGNYVVDGTATAAFEISETAQAPLEIGNKPSLVYYGDTFILSVSGGSGSEAVEWSSSDTNIADIDAGGRVTIKGTGSAVITAKRPGGTNYGDATATYPFKALRKPVTATVTADDKVYDGDTDADIHITWNDLVGTDAIDTKGLTGSFADANAGDHKTVTVGGTYPASDKYDITIPSATASIFKADKAAPALTAAPDLEYNRGAQILVTGGNAGTTVYSDARNGAYSDAAPRGTDAGTYTVWYLEKGDANHNDSEPQWIQVTIAPKTLTLNGTGIELSGNGLLTDNGTCYYQYDGTEKRPTVTIKDGAATVPASEYTVSYSDNLNASTADKKATVTITDNPNGNYTVSGSAAFEIRQSGAQLDIRPRANDLTYIRPGVEQELVTGGTVTGGHLEYKLSTESDADYSTDIPKAENAGTYTVDYKVVGDGNHNTNVPITGSVTVVVKPKTVISPEITVNGGPFPYKDSAYEPTVTIKDGGSEILASEYTLSYQNNVNAGAATVIVTDNNGGNYTVNGTATFEIGKVTAAIGTAPTGKTGLKYNGAEQKLLAAEGSSDHGTVVYSLSENGAYSAAIPTGKDVGSYTVYYKVQGDANHSDSMVAALSPKVEIAKNTVTNPTVQVTPPSVTYNGEKQEPTVTVRDDDGLVIDGSEYTAVYTDSSGSAVTDLINADTYTLTVTGKGTNYSFTKNAEFKILEAGQTPLTITGTREQVCYGNTIQLGITGGNGTVTWAVDNSSAASIDENTGLLKITGVGSVTVTATSKAFGYTDQTATWALYAEKKAITAIVTAEDRKYDGSKAAALSVTWNTGDLVEGDSIAAAGLTGEFTDANAGMNKTVKITGTLTSDNYAITVPPATTASIFKADIADGDVNAPTAAAGLEYSGLPQALVDAGSSDKGTMEYSTDNINYSASLPTGTDAKDYTVWYRVKGDGNHNDTVGTKLAAPVNIAPQEVAAPKIELTPSSASYNGGVYQPEVTVKDNNNRVIPEGEYTVTYVADGGKNWKDQGTYTVTITDVDGGNYNLTGDDAARSAVFTILPADQTPLTIVGQPGRVQYGDSFGLSATGGSSSAVVWSITDNGVASIDQNGMVKVLKSGGATVTATKAADGGHAASTVTWSFNAEKKPVTPIVTAKDKEFDGNDTAQLVITWRDGDLLNGDTIDLTSILSGKFDSANAGTGKNVTITGTAPDSDRYAITIPGSTTASITPKAATLSGGTPTTLEYTGSAQNLVTGITATDGVVAYSTDGSYYTQLVPTGTKAGTYPVWYKAQASGNYKDSDPVRLNVTINPKELTLTGADITLSPDSFEYDGTAKKPDVVVRDGSVIIPAGEYTVSYDNNVNAGTATVTITDNADGNYTVSGSKTFAITAGAASLTAWPEPLLNLTYTGAPQRLVKAGTAVNGTVVYSLTEGGSYKTTIPSGTDAGTYTVWYKVQGANGSADTEPDYVTVKIQPRKINPEVYLAPESFDYTGSPCEPDVLVLDTEGNPLTEGEDYTIRYWNNTNVGANARVIVTGKGNYQFSVTVTFEIAAAKAKFTQKPTAIAGLKYNGTAQKLVNAGAAEGGTAYYSLDRTNYSALIPTATGRGSYIVYAKVQGDETHEDSAVIEIPVKIGVNTVQNPVVTLSRSSFPYTGGEQKPAVTVVDGSGNTIPADEYTVTYSDNVVVSTADKPAKVIIQSKADGNYSFTAEATFSILPADQTPLAITGKQDTVYYGDTLSLGTTGGSGTGAVTWAASGPVDELADGQYRITSSGSVTITATEAASGGYGETSDTWTFFAKPKPVKAVVTAASKEYDGDNTATLTVTISSGLVNSGDIPAGSVAAAGHFVDERAGENKTVVITGLTIQDSVKAKYDITWDGTTTASITPKPASVAGMTGKTGLTYNGTAQALVDEGTAVDGTLMYSLDGQNYSSAVPTGTDAKSYTVWYKAAADDENHRDSAAVKLGDVTIGPNTDKPSVLCSTATCDGTEQNPTVTVRDSARRVIPESEYTVALPAPRIEPGDYTVTVTDKPGGNYEFSGDVTGTFTILAAGQSRLSIVTDGIPTNFCYGDTFRLSVTGTSGTGAVVWGVDNSVANITSQSGNSCVVTVTGVGGFTVTAYQAASGGYGQSNTDSVPFVAQQKPITPVVRADDKPYDGTTDATLHASWNSGDLVGDDELDLSGVSGEFAMADAGTGKQVNITDRTVTGTNVDKYAITWPTEIKASIYPVDAKLATAPAAADLTYTGSAQALIADGTGTTVNNIGVVEYSTSQNGAYSTAIPTGTNAGTYTVWYKVVGSVNYTGIDPAAIEVEIKKATPTISTPPSAGGGSAGQPLSSFVLGGAAMDVAGTFAWENPDIVPEAGKKYNVIFTPNDTVNYSTVTLQVEAVSASGGSGTNNVVNTPNTGGGSSDNASAASAPVRATVRNGTASASVSAAQGSRLVNEAVANQSRNIVIQPEISGDVTRTSVTIPASTVSQINSRTDAALTVSAPIADVTIPNEALSALGGAGGAVNVAAEQVGDAVALTLTAGGETVNEVPGGVTLTVPAEDAGPGTVAVLVKEDGTRQVIQKSVARDGSVSIPLDGSATVELVDNSREFEDVSSDSWASDAVAFASAHELFSGTSETTFSPDESMSRGMLATVLYNLEGQPDQDTAVTYSDVSGEAWYADGVAWAAENGIVSGYGDGQFGPDDSITREQFAVMLWNYAGKPEASEQALDFKDADQVSGYAQTALCWAVENGILNGYGGQLAPGATATRAQAAQMLKNFMENT